MKHPTIDSDKGEALLFAILGESIVECVKVFSSMASSTDIIKHAQNRRTVAIISHPDAGKTTLTEALLKETGEITVAGTTSGKANRKTTVSDWMTLEQERGISVASSAVRLHSGDCVINLLDTPGHGDFSEDTYRVLSAVDSAVMLLDAGKGIEPQTRKLFEVCRARNMPIITFINKVDRPALNAMELIDEVERELNLNPVPLNWPTGDEAAIAGLVHADGREEPAPWARETSKEDWEQAHEFLEMARESIGGFDEEKFYAGSLTPVLFGAAARGYGVNHLVKLINELAPAPTPRVDDAGNKRELDAPFAAQVFKLQANMDPGHRDVAAYLRICSGGFKRGEKVTVTRSKRPLVMSRAVEPFGQNRETVEEAWPGDVIVLPGSRDLRIGDTLTASKAIQFPRITTFVPNQFRELSNRDISRRKQFQQGIQQLGDEGVVQIYVDPKVGIQRPICAAVGTLQYEVFEHRMQNEFGVEIGLSPLPLQTSVVYSPDNDAPPPRAAGMRILESTQGVKLLAFGSDWALANYRKDHPDLILDDVL